MVVVSARLILDSLGVDFIKLDVIIKCVWRMFIADKIFTRIPCKYFLRNKLCTFLMTVIIMISKLRLVLFLYVTSEFK